VNEPPVYSAWCCDWKYGADVSRGEEFVLLLPDTSIDQFSACCERLREAFAAAEPVGVHVKGISLSAGMTLLHCDDELDDALQRADQALYRAKRDGRNRCAAAWQASDA